MSREARFACGRCWHFLWTLTLLLSSLSATAQGALCIEGCKCVRFTSSMQVEMECINLGLTRVPDLSDFASNLTILSLENNKITQVTKSDFSGLEMLGTLTLSYNEIRSIEDGAFSKTELPVLEYLFLKNNHLESLPDNVFQNASLQSLDLSYNNLTSPPRAIGKTTIIKSHLTLNNNPFRYLEEDAFFGIQQTQSGPTDVDLCECELTGFAPETFRNFGGLVDLRLDKNSFQELTKAMFAHVTTSLLRLHLRECGIETIAAGTFQSFGNLEELFLRGNKLEILPRNPFRGLSLRILDLSNCRINNILRGALRARVSKTLRLDENNITVIKRRDFLELEGVQELVLSNSNISQLNGNPFENFTDLGELYLDGNQLDDDNVGAAISSKKLSRLYFLDLSRNRLTRVPNLNAAKFPLMRDLILGENEILSLNRAHLENMTTLKTLNIKRNGLQKIESDALEEVPELSVLDMDYSEIAELPSLKSLPKLQNLHVSHSHLRSLPNDLCTYNTQLRILQATDNDIREIPPLTGCSELFSVALGFNEIEKLEDDQFAHLPFLDTISLEANKIQSLPVNAFANLTRLISVALQRNRIEDYPVGIFSQSRKLSFLNLGFNKIREVKNETFYNNSQLKELRLNNNLIVRLHKNAFPQNMQRLEHLNISSNDLSTWELPRGGFPYLHTLSMQKLFRLHQAPQPRDIRLIQVLEFTYAYHCCIWRDFVHENDTLIPSDDEPATELTVTVNPTDVGPITLPPNIIHMFDDNPFVAECINHPDNPITELQREHIKNVAKQFDLTVIILDNCVVEFLSKDGTPLGTDDDYYFEDAKEVIFEPPEVTDFQDIRCIPHPNPLTPCQNLMDPWFLRVAIWAVWVLAVLGNGTVLFVMIIAREKIDAPQFFICNLAFADFCLGVYLTFLAVVDVRTYGDRSFYQSALNWQLGPGCQTAGFLAVFSSELSVFILGGLTLERVHTIASTFNVKERMRMRAAVIVAVIGWIFAGTLAMLPLVGVNSYTQVAVCLPFVTERFSDKLYIGLILSINLFTFLIILGSYIYIFCSIRRSPAANQDRKEIYTAAAKIAILILATFACWFPLATIAYAALADNSLVDAGQAKYFIVFVYPLNACINPFVYAIFTRNFREKLWSFCRRKKHGPSIPNLHIQRSRDIAMTALHSPSGNTTAEDLMRIRQSRRAFSVQLVDRNPVKSPTPPILAIPGSRMGRRSSLPAILGNSSLCAAHEQHVHNQSRRGSGASITSATSAVASGATTPIYPLPFRLGPLYSHLNRSLPELVEENENEIEMDAVRERLEVALSESHTSSDSGIRRLSVVREESESDLRIGAEYDGDKVPDEEQNADNVSIISADSEDFSDAQDSLERDLSPEVNTAFVRQSPPPHVLSTGSLHEVSVSPLEERIDCNGYATPTELESYSPAAPHSPLSVRSSSSQRSPRKPRIECTNPLASINSLEGNCGCDVSHSVVHNCQNHEANKKSKGASSVSTNSSSHQTPVSRYVLLSSSIGSRGKMIGSETDV